MDGFGRVTGLDIVASGSRAALEEAFDTDLSPLPFQALEYSFSFGFGVGGSEWPSNRPSESESPEQP